MTGEKSLLTNYEERLRPIVTFGDNNKGCTKGYGLLSNGSVSFEMVAFVDGLKHNLLSISQLCDKGFLVDFKKDKCILKDKKGGGVAEC